MPPALRVWLTRTQPLVIAASMWSLFVLFATMMMGINAMQGLLPWAKLLPSVAFLVGPWSVLGLARLLETRRALAAGYDLSDLRAAATAEAVRKREEFAYDAAKPTLSGRIARRLAIVSLGSLFGLIILSEARVLALPGPLHARLGILLAIITTVSGIAGIVMPGRWSNRDVASDFGARFWRSRFGALAAKLAGFGLGRRARAADAAHRATEILLGEELDELYQALPAETRRQMDDVPGTIKWLTASAESLRGQVEAARALGQAVDRQQDQLMAAVAALEILRVGLLRLRAGTVSLEGFTTDLDAVRQVGERVDLLVDARREVDRLLPRRVADTPL